MISFSEDSGNAVGSIRSSAGTGTAHGVSCTVPPVYLATADVPSGASTPRSRGCQQYINLWA